MQQAQSGGDEQSSAFDSLAPYEKVVSPLEQKKRSKVSKNPMASMHLIFQTMRELREVERDRKELKILS